MLKLTDEVAFILIKKNKMLIETRSEDARIDSNKRCIPRGHIKEGESIEDALIRKVREELDVEAKHFMYLGNIVYPVEHENLLVNYFLVEKWEGEELNLEAQSIQWVELNTKNVDIWLDKLMIEAIQYQMNGHTNKKEKK